MRLCKFLFTLAVLSQCTSSLRAQALTDGACSVPLSAGQFRSIVENAGVQEFVDFAISAPFLTTSPVADGKVGASEYGNKCYFTFAEDANPGHSWPNLDNLNDGDADLTANMYFAHTNESLFVAFEVFDDFLDLDFPANSFQNDGVELFINPDLDNDGGNWGPGKFQVYSDAAGDGDLELNNRGVTGGGPVPVATGDPQPGEWYSAGLVAADQKSYVVEYEIPLGSLDKTGGEGDLTPVATGDVILFNTAIDDNDEGDDLAAQTGHHIMWHFDGAGSPWGGGEAIWPVPLQLSPATNAGIPGDVNGSGALDAGDIDSTAAALRAGSTDTKYDLNKDGSVSAADHAYLVETLFKTYMGDANLDKEFNSGDFIAVFQVGEYEDATADNSTWAEGDWNGDADFDSSDFITAFQAGGYEAGPKPAVSAVPEPSSAALLSLGGLLLAGARRRRA